MPYSTEKRKFGGPNKYGGQRKTFDKPRRAPLPEGFSLFYVAINCPEDVNNHIQQMKDYMEQKYGSRAAKKSPAHLTIIPPFRAEDEMEKQLKDFIDTFNFAVVPFTIKLKDFGQFGERVLFVDVALPNNQLQALEKECMEEFSEKFPGIIFGMKPDFNPHVTIATRDIPEGKLKEARSYFEAQFPTEMEFETSKLTLFKLVDGWWQIAE